MHIYIFIHIYKDKLAVIHGQLRAGPIVLVADLTKQVS